MPRGAPPAIAVDQRAGKLVHQPADEVRRPLTQQRASAYSDSFHGSLLPHTVIHAAILA